MGESIKVGGIGKNPAIEKINKINEMDDHMQAVSLLEEHAFKKRGKIAEEGIAKRKQIIEEFHICFREKE